MSFHRFDGSITNTPGREQPETLASQPLEEISLAF
jgi:hypothetical protein